MKHILAVYDVDPVYAARFAEVVNQKEKIPFEVVAFSSIERLRAFAAEHPVKLLLLGEHVPAEEKESIRAEKVILLSDNGGKPVSPSVPCVYKYQSSDAIVRADGVPRSCRNVCRQVFRFQSRQRDGGCSREGGKKRRLELHFGKPGWIFLCHYSHLRRCRPPATEGDAPDWRCRRCCLPHGSPCCRSCGSCGNVRRWSC